MLEEESSFGEIPMMEGAQTTNLDQGFNKQKNKETNKEKENQKC